MVPTRLGRRRGFGRRGRLDAGFTLVELVIAVVLLGGITASIAAALATSVTAADSSSKNGSRSNDAQLISAFLVMDAQAAGGVNPLIGATDPRLGVFRTPDPACTDVGHLVVRFVWIDRAAPGGLTHVAAYYLDQNLHQVVRRTCTKTAPDGSVTTTAKITLGRNVLTALLSCSPKRDCTGQPVSAELTVTETKAKGASPFTFALLAFFRPNNQPRPSELNAAAVLLALGSEGSCAGGPPGASGLSIEDSATVTVAGGVLINTAHGGTCTALFMGPQVQYSSRFTGIFGSGTCAGSACPPPNLFNYPSPIPDPFAGSATGCGSVTTPTNTTLPDGRAALLYPPRTNITSDVHLRPGVLYIFCGNVTISADVNASGAALYAPYLGPDTGVFTMTGDDTSVDVASLVAGTIVANGSSCLTVGGARGGGCRGGGGEG